ncbi:3-oxoacyl-ACP reductase [Micrococcus sp. 2A]|uniref:3-oxoacyl-ACP reductase n=1 Tax=Micrococcus TaxID=1269 RepID=UPI0026070BC6|nr:3-oxoacyl-ACP reductase [Micrococcus sp. M4NT]MDX2340488.1 3-oxoacyl-ACP reductase [Micrococcus sp. M4NT]
MNDPYGSFVSSALGKRVTGALGLPQPVELRRYEPGQPLITGTVLVLGATPAADAARGLLTAAGVQVVSERAEGARLAGVVACFDGVRAPSELSAVALELGPALRQLGSSARVVTVFEDPEDPSVAADPAARAARQGVVGLTRSLGKEMRRGGTANGLILGSGVPLTAPGAAGALRFLLSGRSAFVSGQFLPVTTADGSTPADLARPLEGKVAVVTGAARGIGAAIIATLARDGARVVGVDVPAAGDALAGVVNKLGGTALALDITAPDAGARILEHCRTRHGRMDIVVHNAGITRDKLLANMDAARWDSVLAVNTSSQLAMNAAFLAEDARDVVGEGLRIVGLASTSGIAGNRGQTNYAASKAGVMGLTSATAPMLAERGGTINAVAPGFIETEMTAKIPLATRELGRRLNSLQQGGRPQDVAEAIAYLVSDGAGGTNGATLRVCGQAIMGA